MPPRLPALISDPPPGEELLWLTNTRLFDGTGAKPEDGVSVLVENGRIALVARAGETPPDGARTVDLGGRAPLPGPADARGPRGGSLRGPPRPRGAPGALPGARGARRG